MSKSIGQIVKKLRKERNITQEELAELLNVSSQAISKWENETSMPDISLIVPISKVFGVSTDVLFDTFGTSDEDEVGKIIDHATSRAYGGYLEIQEGLRRYPNNITLLMFSLEYGLSLAYPENDSYDSSHAKEIYEESIRQANIVISYCKNTTDILRAHMIMVLMHSAYGNISQAWEHANQFPWRADMTIHEMSSYIAHFEKKYADESLYCQRDFMYHLEAMLDDTTQNGCAYLMTGKYEDALTAFKSVIALIEQVFKDEKYLPPLHIRERGDVYALIAQTYIKMCDTDNAIIWLNKMADYEINTRNEFVNDMMVETPLLRDVKYTFYWNHRSRKGYMETLLLRLEDNSFESLKVNKEYKTIIERVTNVWALT